MVVTITIPDEVYQLYAAFNPANPRQAIQKQLERFKTVSTSERVLIISGEDRKSIEKLHGTPIEDAGTLAEWLGELTALNLGGDVIAIREGQRKRLMSEALFYKRVPAEYIKERFKQALDQVLGAY